MKQTRYSNEEKLKIIAEAKTSGNTSATAKRFSISDVSYSWVDEKVQQSKTSKKLNV